MPGKGTGMQTAQEQLWEEGEADLQLSRGLSRWNSTKFIWESEK
jgi:hypothetical protein